MARTNRGQDVVLRYEVAVAKSLAELANDLSARVVGVRTVGDTILCTIDYLWLCDRTTPNEPGTYRNVPSLPVMMDGLDLSSPYSCFHPVRTDGIRRIEATEEDAIVDINAERASYIRRLAKKFGMLPERVITHAREIVQRVIDAQRNGSPVILQRRANRTLVIIAAKSAAA